MEIDLICNMASAIRRRWQAQGVVGGFFYKIIKYSSYSFLSLFKPMIATFLRWAIYLRLPDDIHSNKPLCTYSRYVVPFIMLL